MAYEKIATCNYCGTQAPLKLKGKSHHELACPTCSAPLHLMRKNPVRSGHETAARPAPKPSKPKKSFTRRLFSEAFDILDDLLD